jgi:tRNA dimethylallyltransferase
MGETGSGKSDLAEAIRDQIGGQLINADASQVYRGQDVGTAKSVRKSEYGCIDLLEPSEPFGVGQFIAIATKELEAAFDRKSNAVLVGGTGLYIRALFEGYSGLGPAPNAELRNSLNVERQQAGLGSLVAKLQQIDPATAATIDLKNPMRVQRALERALSPSQPVTPKLPPFQKLKLAIRTQDCDHMLRLRQRAGRMMHNGWIEEVAQLKLSGFKPSDPGLRAIGYRTLWRHLDGEITQEEALEEIIADTRRYAKRQRTWLRSEPNLVWVGPDSQENLLGQVLKFLN